MHMFESNINLTNPFERNGIASIDDLNTPEWTDLFYHLEATQADFSKVVEFPREYKWPRDPLRTWSRPWEYVYVYHQLKNLRKLWNLSCPPSVMDFGSGITFFPFAVARLGYNVTCVDIEPSYQSVLDKVGNTLDLYGGSVRGRIGVPTEVGYGSNLYDCIYSVSVIEHIPEPPSVLEDLAISLKEKGWMVVTLDLDMPDSCKAGVSSGHLKRMQHFMERSFVPLYWSPTVAPSDFLTSKNSPYAGPSSGVLKKVLRVIKNQIMLEPLGLTVSKPLYLTCEGWTFRKGRQSGN